MNCVTFSCVMAYEVEDDGRSEYSKPLNEREGFAGKSRPKTPGIALTVSSVAVRKLEPISGARDWIGSVQGPGLFQ